MSDNTVIIIGSGPSGVHAADELTANGVSVLMIDGGQEAPILPTMPSANFEDVRRTDRDQAMLFLGEDLSGIPVSGLTGGLGGGQVSGNRGYVIRCAAEKLLLQEENCQIIQSLAAGGLGAAWGAACAIPENSELAAMGLDQTELMPYLTRTIQHVGISGTHVHPDIQPPLPTDLHASLAREAYKKKHSWFERQNLSVMQPLSAILTKNLGDRKSCSLADMEYWADPEKSVYRPQYTLDELKKKSNFRYEGGIVAESITSGNEGVTITGRRIDGGSICTFRGKKAILAAGAIGSARIALRSLGLYDTPLPFAAKPHVFSACVHLSSLGKKGPKERTSLCQLLVADNEKQNGLRSGIAQLYSYRSLMLFRLLSAQPFAYPEALRLLAMLTPALVIADIRFPARPEHGSIRLQKHAHHDVLSVRCHIPDDERRKRHASWKRIRKGLRQLGMYPVKNMELPEGSSSHYAGTLPFSDSDSILTTDHCGRLRGVKHVSVADAAVFPVLPAVPHTLTIMANARRIAACVGAEL